MILCRCSSLSQHTYGGNNRASGVFLALVLFQMSHQRSYFVPVAKRPGVPCRWPRDDLQWVEQT